MIFCGRKQAQAMPDWPDDYGMLQKQHCMNLFPGHMIVSNMFLMNN
jgi:hypothetical protein